MAGKLRRFVSPDPEAGKAVVKARAHAAAAKLQVRAAKTQLKLARRLYKAAKRAAKKVIKTEEKKAHTSKAMQAAQAAAQTRAAKAAARAVQPKRNNRTARTVENAVAPDDLANHHIAADQVVIEDRVGHDATPLRSAAEVAKSVIERLQHPPPTLAVSAPAVPMKPAPGADREPSSDESS